jgi:hypothetical protein
VNCVEKSTAERNAPDILTFNNGKTVKSAADFEKRRKEIKRLLEEHEYGYMPERPQHLRVETVSTDASFCAGKAPLSTLKFTVTVDAEEFSFPVYAVIPKNPGKLPAIVHINFRPDVPDKYMPSEEIADRGFATFSFCYNDITNDDGNFSDGIAKLLSPKRRNKNSPGKLVMWAWAAMRVMDYIQALDGIDKDNVVIVGHSVLGKSALVAGAFDDRFKYVISNCSGCSGAALTRGKSGESLSLLASIRPYWFSPKCSDYIAHEDLIPIDQHFILAAVAPRNLLIGSAKGDTQSDPESEFISAHLAGEVYEKIYGIKGLVHNGNIPDAPAVFDGGSIHYHIREGLGYFSREDWLAYMNYICNRLQSEAK